MKAVLNWGASAYPALGTAAYFDEQNGTHVNLGTPQHPGNSISIEAWVLLESDYTVGFSPIVARWDGSYELDVNHAGQGGELDFVIRNDLNDFIDPHGDGPMSTDEWHHVVGIFEGESDGGGVATGMVYLDGERQIDFESVGDLQDAGGDDGSWYVGRTRNPDSGFGWLGLIDEVAIYPFVLSEEQILNHINLAMSPAAPNGDFNMNGQLEVGDMDLLSIEIHSQSNNPDFDLNGDQRVDLDDQSIWLADLAKIWSGDANMDGLFNTGDLIIVLAAGEFEDDIEDNSTWGEGDWNADLDFTTSDLVSALADGGYESGMRPGVAAVPEPSTLLLCALSLCWVLKWRAGRR